MIEQLRGRFVQFLNLFLRLLVSLIVQKLLNFFFLIMLVRRDGNGVWKGFEFRKLLILLCLRRRIGLLELRVLKRLRGSRSGDIVTNF